MEETSPGQRPDNTESRSSLNLAGANMRFVNFLIDTIVYYYGTSLMIFCFHFLPFEFPSLFTFRGYWGVILLFTFWWIAYYTLQEGLFRGKTVGKLITRTRAVTLNGQPVGFVEALLRSLCRLIPFEAFSYFAGPVGWHDSVSGTQVVFDRPKQRDT